MHPFIMKLLVIISKVKCWLYLKRITRNPQAIQIHVLGTILAANRNTKFGLLHQFRDIHNYADYKDSVPIQDYQSLRPFIEEQLQNRDQALTAEQPVM